MPRVLVVDDLLYVRQTISIMLKHNFEVIEAETGSIALKKFDDSKFDLAIIDIYMPDMDGVQIMKALRKRAPTLPIIAVSGVLISPTYRTALDSLSMIPELSNVICLQKPFRPNQLMEAIQKVIGVAV